MAWWVWVCLVLLLIGSLGAGVAYAVVHAFAGMRRLRPVANRMSAALSRMSTERSANTPEPAALLTRPIAEVAERYVATQERLIRRAQRARERHEQVWKHFEQFHFDECDEEHPLPTQIPAQSMSAPSPSMTRTPSSSPQAA